MTVAIGHDKLSINHQMVLSLPFREMVNQLIQDRAAPHHPVQGHNLTWASGLPIIPSGLGLGVFDGATAYADSPAALTVDMNFTSEDYSIAVWVYYQVVAHSQIVVGRYGTHLDGWDLHLYHVNSTLSLRHNHGSLAPDHSTCYSEGWNTGQWHLIGISRSGRYPRHFRNGAEIEVSYSAGGLDDPDTANRDLVIGVRGVTKNANWYSGYMTLLRVWGSRAMEEWEHRQIFEEERHWFGV
jgi:hypothetical protein